MPTPAQLVLIRGVIDADPELSNRPQTPNDASIIADTLNAAASPDYFVWQSSTSVQVIFDAINWANMTPSDAPDGTAAWTNRALACQGKQFNLQTMTTGREAINSNKVNIRAGLQDALTNLPSGTAGASRSGGWTNVQLAMQRKASRAEKALVASGAGTNLNPGVLGFEGNLTYVDVLDARAL
jgi:hypothetical protein